MFCISVSYHAIAQVSVFQNITTSEGLPSNYVFQVDEDENGFLWAGTDKGLAFYNGFKWQSYTTDNLLPGNYVNHVLCSGKGGIWLEIYSKGIYYYNFQKNFFLEVTRKNGTNYRVDKEGNLYYSLTTKNNGNIQYSVSPNSPTRPEIITPNSTGDLNKENLLLKDKKIIGSIPKDSLYYSFEAIYKQQTNGYFLQRNFFNSANKKIDIITTPKGYWIFNSISKVYFSDKSLTKIIQYDTCNGLLTSLISSIYISKNNQTFISTMGAGIQTLMPEGNWSIGTNNMQVTGLTTENNLAYAVTEKNLYVINLLNSSLKYKFDLLEKQVMNVSIIDKKIYISTLYGFSIYAIIGNRLVKKEFIDLGSGISSVIKVNESILTSSYGNGISEAGILRKSKTKISPIPYAVLERMQNLSFGFAAYNYEDGLFFFNKSSTELAHLNTRNGLPSNTVYHVFEEGDSLWISTAKGISVAKNFKIVKSFLINTKNNTEKCIFCFKDNSNRLWMVTNKGLWRFEGNKFIATYHTLLIENKNDQINEAVFNKATNSLLAGTDHQLFILNMDKIHFDSTVLIPALLKATADEIVFNPASKNKFSYNTDKVTFTFRPTFINNFTRNSVYYKLQGLTNDYQKLTDSLTLQFSKLRPGKYMLYAKAINVDGFESESTLLNHFTIEKPFWQKWWFSTSIAMGCIFITYSITRRMAKKRHHQLENENKMAQQLIVERERISKELHDNLGSNLVTMIARADNIEINLLNDKTEEALKKTQELSNHSRETVNILRETIWAVQENEHSLEDFVLRVKNYLQRTLPVNNMEWLVNTTGKLDNLLPSAHTLHLFRIIQETTQNIIKHSHASMITYDFEASNSQLLLRVSDNGIGFDFNQLFGTHGLKNIESRINDLGGKVSFLSNESSGTTILITITI